MPSFRADQLQALSRMIFLRKGASEENAETVAQLLVKANLAGHDSHGVIRVPSYVKLIDEGRINPRTHGHLEIDKESVGLFDGDLGFGQVAATEAMKIAVMKARSYGTSAIGIYNCGHIGRMADYCMMAMKEGFIGLTMTTSDPFMAPFGGVERKLNPSPFGIAAPAGKERPFVLDISMSACAVGKIRVKKARGEKLPQGWIVDRNGNPSIEPDDFFNGGSVLPMGGSVAYKGYGLAFMVDILSGALTGGGCASGKDFEARNNVFMMVIDVSRFTPLETFKNMMDQAINNVKKSRKAPGVKGIMIPGEPEFLEEQKRLAEGIFVEDVTWHQILSIAVTLGVDIPVPVRA